MDICELYNKGEIIKSLKKHCNLIICNDCETEIMLDYRKKLYSTFVSGNNGIDDDVIKMFKCAIEKCTFNNAKYNIPFIKKTISYLEQKSNVNYDEILVWLNYYDISLLNDNVYGNNKYSDRELYYLKKAKALDETKQIEDLKRLQCQYEKENKQNYEILFFIKFHICKSLFNCKKFDEANEYLEELIIIKREKYVLGLPIKYGDYTNEKKVIMYILEILLDGLTPDYLYAYIINWLKGSSYYVIVESVSKDYKYIERKYVIDDYNKLKKGIISNICKLEDISDSIKDGKLTNITKIGNGFVQIDRNNYFVDKKYLGKNIKKGLNIKCFIISKYNQEKKKEMKEAIIINRRYYNEVLCGKEGK